MLKKGEPPKNLLPDADPEQDCQSLEEGTIESEAQPETAALAAEEEDHDDHEHDVSWRVVGSDQGFAAAAIDSWIPRRASWTLLLERVALAVERPANRLIGTAQLNPFYHTGTIATLLLGVVALTGFFLFLFFQYGFDASYNAVLTRIEMPFIARTVRAIHRYASAALVITSLLHAYRTLFMERFRGPRWLAWVTGIAMTLLLWFAGVTGYWLVWDTRAQLINDAFVDFLGTFTPFAAPYMVAFTNAARSGSSWSLFLIVFAVHLLLFLIVAGFYWYHIKRLNRPKWLPPVFWVVGVSVVLLLVSALFPAGMLPQGDLSKLPGEMTLDPYFLFFLPVRGNALLNGLLWGGLLLLTILLALLPWLSGRRRKKATPTGSTEPAVKPTVNIIKDRCTGCTVCAVDCPYGAIEMVERTDGRPHKYIAIEDPGLCVSCGICVGSCDGVAVTLGQTPPSMLWDTVAAQLALAKLRGPIDDLRVVFTCERHAAHGARMYIEQTSASTNGMPEEVVTLPCVGTAPPDLLARTLDEGVANVHIVGCPADDCANREGNLWLEQRIVRERVPRLKRPYADAPITASWLPPDDFALGIAAIPAARPPENGQDETPDYLELRRILQPLTWRNYLAAFSLLTLVMIVQVLLTDLPYFAYAEKDAVAQIVIPDIAAPIGRASYMSKSLGPTLDLRLEIDDQLVFNDQLDTAEVLQSESYPYFEKIDLNSGDHRIRLSLVDPTSSTTFVFADAPATLNNRAILTLPVPLE